MLQIRNCKAVARKREDWKKHNEEFTSRKRAGAPYREKKKRKEKRGKKRKKFHKVFEKLHLT